jgi:hypothetical protein
MASMLTNNPLPAFQIVPKRANKALLKFLQMPYNLGNAGKRICRQIETAIEEVCNKLG